MADEFAGAAASGDADDRVRPLDEPVGQEDPVQIVPEGVRRRAVGGMPSAAEGRRLVVICRSGHRSQQAAKLPAGHGATAADVKGGMNAWAAAGLPVVDARGSNGRIV
ncbi:rhodanese-like domain-containing protein [Streptomyces sp. NPDC001591]|uniref:rhodanese-like domain-containing protein n=1 Tax=Streptomyces sp. NPDC001591 TaxID=3364589 RepID=UPI00367F048A